MTFRAIPGLISAIFVFLFIIVPGTIEAKIIYVDKDAGGAGSGMSWGDAYNDIAPAISDSNYGDQIWVASGIYQERVTMKNGISLYGGFTGGETSPDQRNYAANQTVIDANYTGCVVTIANMADANTRVDGFVITKGDAIHGGGIHISASAPVIAHNVITTNKTNGLGGGIYCFGFNPVTGEQPTIIGNHIVDNLAYEDEGNGGGIGCHGSSPTIVNNIIARNIASRNGGGISCWASESDMLVLSSSPVIANNFILANSSNVLKGASGLNTGGGGIHCTATDLSGSPIEGAVCEARIINNVIAANGGWLGGGICALDSIEEASTIVNNTIVANSGSGIYWQNTSPLISNNLVAYNTWGLEQNISFFTNPIIKYNCVYGNTVKETVSDFKGLTDPTGSNGNISAEPKMAAYDYGDFHIQPTSPCVDAGDMNSLGISWTDIDDQNRTQGLAVDIGADESDGTTWDVAANIIHVKPDGNDAQEGFSWPTAKQTITAGIDAAASTYGDVWVAQGTYTETINLPAFVYLYGGFDGTESNSGQRDIQHNITIIDANKAGCVVSSTKGGYKVSRIDGFTIKNGSPLIQNMQLVKRGGGIHTLCCSPIIANNTITLNQADDPLWSGFLLDGGGMYIYLGYPEVTGNYFSENKVNNYTVGKGGAIYSHFSMPALVNNFFSQNTAREGPAVCAEASEPYMTRNIFFQNQGPAVYGASKGAITCFTCTNFVISDNLISNNVAAVGGGINIQACMSGRIQNNLILYNYAYEVSSGSYGAGGGIFLEIPQNPIETLYVVNNTIAGNVASSLIEHQGGGIAIAALSNDAIIANNIIAFNSSGIWKQFGTTGVPVLNYNCVYNSGSNYVRFTPGPNDISVDPNFVDMPIGNFRLAPVSACIDAGDNNSVPEDVQHDLNLFPRFIDDKCTADSGSGTPPLVDMGVYEFLRSDINSDGNLDFIDYTSFATHWLETECGVCGGADFTCEGNVDGNDLREFTEWWLAGK